MLEVDEVEGVDQFVELALVTENLSRDAPRETGQSATSKDTRFRLTTAAGSRNP